ncbi:hypothetical protein [Nostoc sp. 'Peltigera malacea cyanobiont' DB3992]|uniref:hypothetical protein n=1 Tax=Nostoc sp. 'Peltigera malacea cyanobiont' DB3992 TaxID=1206980 RepID=UPI0026BE1E4B|nr:hypothetical protein [Nostoc sp. 'Peltigera malacea cyanobiont' DB3992]
MGTLSVGLLGQAELTLNKKAGLFLGGGFDLLGIQILGVVAIAVFNVGFSFLMFSGLKALGHLCVIIQDNFEQFLSQFFSKIKD